MIITNRSTNHSNLPITIEVNYSAEYKEYILFINGGGRDAISFGCLRAEFEQGSKDLDIVYNTIVGSKNLLEFMYAQGKSKEDLYNFYTEKIGKDRVILFGLDHPDRNPKLPGGLSMVEHQEETAYMYSLEEKQNVLYENMDELSELLDARIEKITLKEGTHNLIPDFDGYVFNKYALVLSAKDSNGVEYEFSEDFYSTKIDNEEAIREVFNYVEVSLSIEGKRNKKTIGTEYDQIHLSDVVDFIKIANPKREGFSIDEMDIFEDYKYLHCKNLSWASDMVIGNTDSCIIAKGLPSVKEKIFNALGLDNTRTNPLIKETIPSIIENEEVIQEVKKTISPL